MEGSGKISATQSKTILGAMLEEVAEQIGTGSGTESTSFSGFVECDPEKIAQERGFEQMDASALLGSIDEIIASNPDEWQRFVSGDEKVTQFFVGQVMRATRGQADGKSVIALLRAKKDDLQNI